MPIPPISDYTLPKPTNENKEEETTPEAVTAQWLLSSFPYDFSNPLLSSWHVSIYIECSLHRFLYCINPFYTISSLDLWVIWFVINKFPHLLVSIVCYTLSATLYWCSKLIADFECIPFVFLLLLCLLCTRLWIGIRSELWSNNDKYLLYLKSFERWYPPVTVSAIQYLYEKKKMDRNKWFVDRWLSKWTPYRMQLSSSMHSSIPLRPYTVSFSERQRDPKWRYGMRMEYGIE